MMIRKAYIERNGVITAKIALLMIPMLGFVALAIDYGYLLKVKTDLQAAADAAAVAAVRELLPDSKGKQDISRVKTVAKAYAEANVETIRNFAVSDSDIETGRFDPATIYTNVTLLKNGTHDTVRVKVRRNRQINSPVKLFFAPVLGITHCDVVATATAVLQRARYFPPGSGVLPFAVSEQTWDSINVGENFRTYNEGIVTDASGNKIAGNWGTVDIGAANNSTADLSNQIREGLRQSDLDALAKDGRIPDNEYIDSTIPIDVQGDPGLSSGLKHAVASIHGEMRYVPVYGSVKGKGNNSSYNIIRWGTVKVVDSQFQGKNNTYLELQKATTFDGKLKPISDLSDDSGFIEGAFTSPGLVE